MYVINPFHIFYERELDVLLSQIKDDIKREIENVEKSKLLNVSEEAYKNYLYNQHMVENLEMEFENISREEEEREISANTLQNYGFANLFQPSYKKNVLIIYIPFTGNKELLYRRPSKSYVPNTIEVLLKDNYICFEIIDIHNNPEQVQREIDIYLSLISPNYPRVKSEVDEFNTNLPEYIQQQFDARKQSLIARNVKYAGFKIPLRRTENLPSTFTIPELKKKKLININPALQSYAEELEPTLNDVTYHEIIEIMNVMGQTFESLPSTYVKKGEEELRDHFILFLSAWFRNEGSVTGETFNKEGKTDILYKYNSKNVFIAECKFWSGIKGYFETLDQIIKNLTWRDSKAAVVIFVKNKGIDPVITDIETKTQRHKNFLKYINKEETGWYNFTFHLNGDTNREIKIAVLIYHIPQPTNKRIKDK